MNELTTMKPSDAGEVEQGITYLRVSSKRQMDTDADVDPDGNSINTQREYCGDKAKRVKVVLAKEFIEPGTSAQTIEKRPVFRELMQYLSEHPEIKYVFIYMRSRAFRNFTDAAITKRQLLKMGVKLISAKEDFGEGIMADAMEAVTDIMNEVQVKLSGQDISIKMLNKAKHGGTLGIAKLGYLNSKIVVDGRKVSGILVDPERKPFIVQAFELFATGNYTLQTLHETLTDAGFKAPGSTKPVVLETIHRMLRDKYYIGIVTYKSMEYQGRHEPLISKELFDKVQHILDSHSGAGTRDRTHPHYLKGTIWCARCKQRFIVQRAKGNGGIYFYFFCRGRQQGTCDHPYVPVEVMEDTIVKHYETGDILPAELRQQVTAGVREATAAQHELSDELRQSFARQLDKLDAKESYFLDLGAEEGWPKDKLRAKIAALRDERDRIQRQLDHTATQLDTGRQLFTQALALLDDLASFYKYGNERVRSILNKAFFTKLYIEGQKVTAQELAEPFDVLNEAYTICRQHRAERQREQDDGHGRTYYRRTGAASLMGESDNSTGQTGLPAWLHAPHTASSADLLTETGATSRVTLIDSLAMIFSGHGSSKAVMVGAAGFEPATPGL